MVDDQDPGTAEEPEAATLPVEEAGDPAPPARRRRGRPRKSEAAPSGSSDAAPAADRSPAVRASKAAIAGAQSIYGLGGTVVTVAGQIGSTPGLMAAGFVMQAQADSGGRVIAKRLAGTRWYPYLERAGTAGELAPLLVGPVAAAMFVEVPPLRPLLAPVVAQLLDGVTAPLPDQAGVVQQVDVWEVLQATAGEVDAARAGAAVTVDDAAANGAGDAGDVARSSPYRDLAGDQAPPAPTQEATGGDAATG